MHMGGDAFRDGSGVGVVLRKGESEVLCPGAGGECGVEVTEHVVAGVEGGTLSSVGSGGTALSLPWPSGAPGW